MSKYSTKVKNLSAEDLAKLFSETTYDYQENFMRKLCGIYERDAKKDKNRGRVKLYDALSYASTNIGMAWLQLKEAWKICENRMEED